MADYCINFLKAEETKKELVYIAKDAHKAAEAMKSHNTTAENKYRDQANDSATVRHFRKTSGTPDWYKKKYGHMKEDAPTNSVGTGAETSLPPSVEPGVKKKKVPSFISYVPRRTPQ